LSPNINIKSITNTNTHSKSPNLSKINFENEFDDSINITDNIKLNEKFQEKLNLRQNEVNTMNFDYLQ